MTLCDPRNLPLAILILAWTAGPVLGQEGPVLGRDPAFSIQIGVLFPDDFGDLPPPVFAPAVSESGVARFRDAEPGALFGVRLAVPLFGRISLEGSWEFARIRTLSVEVVDGRMERERPGLEHSTHVYLVGARYAPMSDDRVHPHATASFGGISLFAERGEGHTHESGSVTDPVFALGVGLTIPLDTRYGVRADVRDIIQFCEAPDLGPGPPEPFNPCAEDGPRHHLGVLLGIEAAF